MVGGQWRFPLGIKLPRHTSHWLFKVPKTRGAPKEEDDEIQKIANRDTTSRLPKQKGFGGRLLTQPIESWKLQDTGSKPPRATTTLDRILKDSQYHVTFLCAGFRILRCSWSYVEASFLFIRKPPPFKLWDPIIFSFAPAYL